MGAGLMYTLECGISGAELVAALLGDGRDCPAKRVSGDAAPGICCGFFGFGVGASAGVATPLLGPGDAVDDVG